MEELILKVVTLFFIAVILIVVVLNFIQNRRNKKLKKMIEKLEYEKNIIDGSPISPELSKIEAFLKNEKLERMYNDWKIKLEDLKANQIPKITDMIIETEYTLSRMDYKGTTYKLAKLEMEIYKVRTYSEFLLSDIMQITTSEEKNREIITGLKSKYRELFNKFNENKSDYGDIAKYITLQFENISSRFEQFERFMEENEYTEVTQIIKSIDEMLKHMEVVTKETPLIVLTATNVLNKKMTEVQRMYDDMIKNGFPLDYLNIEYNIAEANKKIDDIMDRLKVLNLEDSLFELKILMDYFDSVFDDFEKEKITREDYEEGKTQFKIKLDKTNKLVEEIFYQIEEVKNVYNLSKSDISMLGEMREELKKLNEDFRILNTHTNNNTFAYSKLLKEIEGLSIKLKAIEGNLDIALDALGNMREDEVRARQQLEEIKVILKDSKMKIRDYNIPVIPKNYYIELNEATAAIKEIIKELDKSPITIATLNTRVDTARDLVLKFYTRNKELVKTAMFAEMAIVYGNRYRTVTNDIEKYLSFSELLFFKGDYQKSLELSINALNKIEPGIYEKLLKLYENKCDIN